jgi:DNA-binding transcriptional MerR regulator/methylmalonyl-CoA mutase cobalamin-binding subunit
MSATPEITEDTPRHPVRFVSERTGLSPHVLRVWERRYGAVRPVRSEGGQRLYSDADVIRLQLLGQAVEGGHNISRLVGLTNEALMEMVASDRQHRDRTPTPTLAPTVEAGDDDARILTDCMSAIERMDGRALEKELRSATLLLPLPVVTDRIVAPLLREIGSRWKDGRLGPAQEHLASAVIRRVLDAIVRSFEPSDDAYAIVVGTPVGQEHELGALLSAIVAGSAGWRVIYLGANLPAQEFVRAAAATRAAVIALSIIYPRGDVRLRKDLVTLVETMPRETRLLLGGSSALAYARHLRTPNVNVMDNLGAFRDFLAEIGASS